MTARIKMPTEEEEQIALFEWAEYQFAAHPELLLLFHIPNGGSRRKGEAGRFRAMGVKAGVPDLFLPVARGGFNGLFIEMKRSAGGRLSDAQNEWIDRLRAEGYLAEVCEGWEKARETVLEYLGLGIRD